MHPEMLVRRSHCNAEAPAEIAALFQRLLEIDQGLVSGEVEEAGWSPRLRTMRAGGGVWGAAIFSCPDHCVQTGIVRTA